MATPQDIFNQYLSVDSGGKEKPYKVLQATQEKQQALSDKQAIAAGVSAMTGLGQRSMPTQIESDLVNLTPIQIIQKYGQEQGTALLQSQMQGTDAYMAAEHAQRGDLETVGDALNQVVSGFGQTVGGIGALGVGLVNDEGGAVISETLDRFNQGMADLRSAGSTRSQEAFDARTALREQESTSKYEKEIADGVPDWAATLARIGGDAAGAAGDVLTNPTQLLDLTAQGVGSMAAIPLVAGELAAAVPAGAATRLIAGAIGPTRTAVKAGRAVEKVLPATAAIGLTESGGSFVQATNEVMNMKFEDLAKVSSEFNKLVAGGMTPEDARAQLANDSGTQAALTQLPAALAAGALVSKFEAAPGARRSVTDTLANLGKETLEEGTQSATSQLAVNQAIQSNVDAKRELTAGVGTQLGVGAVAGLGTAGAVQTPGVIAQGVADTFNAAKTAVNKRLDGLRRANEQASPVSDDRVTEQATQVETTVPAVQAAVDLDENLTPERKAELNQLVQDVTESAIQLDGDSLAQDESQPPAVREAAAGQSTMVGYLQSLSRIAADEKRPELDRVHAHMALSQTVQAISGFLDQLPDSVQDLTEDHPVREFIGSIQEMNAALMSSPSVSKATEQAPAVMQKAVDANPLTETSDANVAGIHLAAADLAPQTATRESVDTLLKMATKGKLQLNEQQYTNLTMLKKMFDNAAAYDAEVEQAGAQSRDIVSRAIKTGTSGVDGELSALQHAQGIRQALVQGDVEGAKARLEDLGMFAQHMQNKVNAINSHMATENPTKATAPTFQKLVGTLGNRSFVNSGNPIGVTPTSANSIRQAQLISAEADFVTNTFNTLAETFPQLGIQPMALSDLDAQLDGRPEELAAQFTAAKEKAKQKPKAESKPAPAKAEPAPVAEQQAAPAPTAGQEVTPEFEQTKLTAIRAMSDADLKRHLKTLTNDLMNEDSPRKARVVEMITAEQQARAELVMPEPQEIPWLFRPAPEAVQEEAAPVAEPEVAQVEEQAEPVQEPTIDTTTESINTPVADMTDEALLKEFNKLDQIDRRLSRDEIIRMQDIEAELERREDQAEAANASESDSTVVENPMLSAYPNLIGGANNRFVNTFNLPMNPISKLDGSKTPIRDVLKGLKDTVDDTGALRAFQAILGDFPNVLAHMNNELAKFMSKKPKALNGKTIGQATLDGSIDPTIYPNGRAAAIAELGDNGFVLNTELAAKAYLAGVNWLLNGMSFIQLYDTERAAKVLGIDESEVTEQQMELLSNGVTRLQAIDALAANIQRYWGVTKKADVVDGFTKGIPQAMAANIIDMMLSQQFNGETTLTETKLELGLNRDPVIYTPVSLGNSGLNEYRDAIEKLVAAEPELVVYMGDNMPPVAKTQLNNPTVENTPDQIKVIENLNATGYTVNLQTLGVYEAMGEDNIIALFGEANVDPATTNENTLLSRTGRNVNIKNAWDAIKQTMFQMELQAEDEGIPVEQVAIRYAHNMTSVGRAQQIGRYTPQSSKMMRTVFLPTNSKPLNLTETTSQDWRAFMLSLGQLLGEKVHNFDPAVTEEILFGTDKKPGLLNGKYARVIEVLQDQIQSGRAFSVTELNMFKDVMGKPTFETFQALTDYARFLNTEDKSQYVTQLYLEADGMSNGPFNSMALFTMGDFTKEQLKNLAKCGLYFGGAPEARTSWVQRMKDTVDLYEEVAVRTLEMIKGDTIGATAQTKGKNQKAKADAERYLIMRGHMNRMMGILLPDVVKLNEDGDIVTIKRNITKNPTTITTYGSGKKGIADKLTNSMLDNLYVRISDALLAQSQDPTLTAAQAMFPDAKDTADAEKKLAMLDESMKALTSHNVIISNKTGYNAYALKGATPEQIKISTDYTIDREAFQTLTGNVNTLIVNPMNSAIQSTLDPTVGVAVQSLRMLTQVQGIILANAYQKRVNELVAKKGEEGYILGGYLSAKQQKEILQSLAPLRPQIRTGDQNFFISGGEKANLQDDTPYGTSFDNVISATPTVYAPTNPGVKGIATMVIGSGDGMTIQRVALDPTNTERALFIFDGINYPLDFIQQGSLAANKAAFDAILGNPMMEVSKTFDAFLAELDGKLEDYTDMSLDMRFQIGQALFGPTFTLEDADTLTGEMLLNYLEGAAAAGRKNALAIQARHNVLKRVNLGMDQMAAAGSPYLVTDKIELVGEPHEIANQLSQLYKEELVKLVNASMAADKAKPRRKPVVSNPVNDSGATVLTGDSIRVLAEQLKGEMTRPQQLIVSQAVKKVVADGYKIITGSYEQLMAYNQDLGENGIDFSLVDQNTVDGMTMPTRKEIWIMDMDTEVFAHEMLHAATFNTVLAYAYNRMGEERHEFQENVTESLDAIYDLMNQFINSESELLGSNPSIELVENYRSAVMTITDALSNPYGTESENMAVAINEYMAWGLANKELAEAQATVPVRISRLLSDTIKAIKQWLFGSQSSAFDDMLSNLVFHTKVVMDSAQPSLTRMTNDTSLFMARVYGHDQRLTDLDRTFNQKVADYVAAQGPVQQVRRTNEVALSGINAFHMVGLFSGNGFPMTAQEANTFYKIVAALGTQAKLDPAVMNRMQELYSAVTRELTPESFMKDPQSNNPADYAQALQKYEVVMGQRGVGKDPIGRSTLMPAFMALALTNDTFREVLAKLPVPRTEASTQERAFDRLLENQANKMLDQLSDVLSGQKRSANVQQAIDNLAYQLVDAAQQSQGFYDQYVTPLGTLADKANATIVESMNKVADKFTTLAEQRRQAGKNQKLLDQAINNGLEVAASIINEDKAGLLGEAILAGANASQSLPKWMHDLVADLVGRVDSNADLYDMIKKVRSSIQRLRNQFRTELPKTLAKQFTRKVTKEEWTIMHNALGKTDLAAVVQNGSFTRTDTLAMLGNQPALNRGIRKLEDEIKALDSKFATQYLDKAQQLATFMMTGVPGMHLARNARAITRRLGTKYSTLNVDPALERAIDSLVSLYAVDKLSDADKQAMGSLVQSQKSGVEFTFGYALGLHNQELSRLGDSVNGQAFVNHYKGHMPTLQQDGVSLIIADDKEFAKLLERSYVRKAPYQKSALDYRSAPLSYYYAPVNGRSNFNQGIVQNVRQTMGGVDSITGYTVGGLTGGRITDPRQVARIGMTITAGRFQETGTNLLPVYDVNGSIVAYERSADPTMVQSLNYNTHFGEVMGAWKGRLAEETLAVQSNQVSIEYMAEMYRKDTANNSANKAQYVDLFDGRLHNKYPVIEDALKLFTPSTVDAIHAQFPDGHFWVRKEMLDNVIGYRSATVGDAWTGNTYWSKETQEAIRKTAMLAFGNKAYGILVNAEQTLQGVVQDAKTLIIIKSVVVPVANMLSNMLQLVARGVPVRSILAGLPKKLAETRQYVASEKRAIEAEAELHATTDAAKQRRLKVEIQSIRDSYKRMSIWPLIERGELSSMSDDAQPEDQELVAGKLNAFIEAQVNKLPPAIRAAGKYALITKDTALYKGLRKSVEYGDFLAKAILWDDLVNRQGKDVEYANGRITEEFVNFDRLGGRNRQYLEAMGLLWFYNFKIRSAKVGLSILRNNPLHALMAATVPVPSSIGSPITDNLFGLAVEGQLGHSIGLDQLISAPMLHPLDNVIF